MHILPAVDIKGGKAVRLFQGQADQTTIYNANPVNAAINWIEQGATYLHIVDLDGAFDGESENEKHIAEIAKESPVPIEVGGGVRSIEKAGRLVDLGVDKIIIGTKALESRAFLHELIREFPEKINVGVDAKEGMVAIKGWVEKSDVIAEDFLRELSGSGVSRIIYTDISRDGALQGVNIESITRATQMTDIPIIASGGVTTVEDIKQLSKLPLFGIITGKALYDGRINLREANQAANPVL